jgi:hypothetical protein
MDDGFACTESEEYTQPTDENGTYEIVGTQAIMTPDGSTTSEPALSFCVKGTAFAGFQMGADGSTASFVAKRE